jgi:hypothetical protein
MATSDRRDDARPTGDALDRVIDEAVETALGASPVDLRAQVLAALEEPADQRRPEGTRQPLGLGPFRQLLFRPSLLPIAGAVLMMAGVGVLWQHVNRQLGQNGARVASTRADRARTPVTSTQPVTQLAAGGAATTEPPAPARDVRDATAVAKAPAWLESDSDKKVAGATVLLADADLDEEPLLPGAPTGDLGDPIAPMPKLRPIVIRPLTAPPISEAPPVSTLAKPVSTLADEVSRDRQDPAKSGGM